MADVSDGLGALRLACDGHGPQLQVDGAPSVDGLLPLGAEMQVARSWGVTSSRVDYSSGGRARFAPSTMSAKARSRSTAMPPPPRGREVADSVFDPVCRLGC